MAKVLRKNNRAIRRGSRLVTDSAACRTACCDGTGGECCRNTDGVPPFHECGKPGARSVCVPDVGSSSYSDSRFYSITTVQYTASVLSGNVQAYIDWANANGVPLPDPGCFPLNGSTISKSFSSVTNTQTIGSYALVRNGPNHSLSPSGCSWAVRVPVRERSETFYTTSGNRFASCDNPGGVPFSDHNEDGGDTERCIDVIGGCWPLSAQLPHDPFQPVPPPVVAGVPVGTGSIPLGNRSFTNTETLPSGETRTTTVTEYAAVTWEGTNTEWVETRTQRRTRLEETSGNITTTQDVPYGPLNQPLVVIRVVQHAVSYSKLDFASRDDTRITIRQGWARNCDDTQGPSVCPPATSDCTPRNLAFIRGVECSGRVGPPVPFVLPAENVRHCGYVVHAGWCYRFDPNGPRIYDPVAIGAVIGSDVVVAADPQSCCECLSTIQGSPCAGVDLAARPEWNNGQQVRDTEGRLTGFRITPPYVSGKCCCSAGDRFQLVEAIQKTEDLFPTGEVRLRSTFEIIPAPNTGNPDVFDFARSDTRRQYGYRYVIEQRDTPEQTFTVIEVGGGTVASPIDGTVDCEWQAFDTIYNFNAPHYWQGLPVVGASAAIPQDVRNTLGIFNGSWGIVYYNLAATCEVLISDVRYERYDDPPPGPAIAVRSRIDSRVTWRIVRDASGPCSGGCTSTPIGPLPPNPGDIPTPIGPGPIANGCAGCGGGGGL